MTQRLLRLHFCLIWLLLGLSFGLHAQQQSPYKNLNTAINTVVFDTISGINLDLNPANPLPKHGHVGIRVIAPGGSGNPYVYELQYFPDNGFIGVDSFVMEYRSVNTYPYLVYRAFRVSVWPSQVTPVTDYATTAVGTPVVISVLNNDVAPWGPLSLTGISVENYGSAEINGNKIVFTPRPGFIGVAHLNYTVCDALNTCQTGSAHIGVHNGTPPVDTLKIYTNKNSSHKTPLTFENYTVSQQPAHGTAVIANGRALRYTPANGYTGIDQFVLKTIVNGQPFLLPVKVKVYEAPPPNQMAVDDTRYTPRNTPVTFNVRQNDIGNLLVRNWVVPTGFPGTLSGTNGSGNVTFTPNPGFTGIATFFYKIGNTSASSIEMATVNIVVDNMAPATTLSKRLHTPQGTPLAIDYKIPYTNFSFDIIEYPYHGTLQFFPGFTNQTLNGQQVSGNNLLVYKPEAGYKGEDEFALLYCAPNGECSTSKIKILVDEIDVTQPPFCVAKCTWPGDINADGIVNSRDVLPLGVSMGLGGNERIDGDETWYPQYSNHWNYAYSAVPGELKHLDADGNGTVDQDDCNVISDNYGKINTIPVKSFQTGKGLPFDLELLTPNPAIGELIKVKVSLGNDINPALDVYAFNFDMNLSKGMIDSAFQVKWTETSWFNRNAPVIALAKRASAGKFETACSRTNGEPASGQGQVAVVEFIVIEIIVGGGQNERALLTLNPNITLADGTVCTGNPVTLELPLRKDRNDATASIQGDISVYPQPASDRVRVSWGAETSVHSIQLRNLAGDLVMEQADMAENADTQLDVSNLPSGLYVLTAMTGNGPVAKKIQVVR